MTPEQTAAVINAAREWSEARQNCLRRGGVTREEYSRLAKAEAELQAAVREIER